MSDISRGRRMLGRLLFGAAAVAVPLTASVSYAQSDRSTVEEVDVAPSDAADADAPEVRRDVKVIRLGDGAEGDAEAAEGEKDVFVYRMVHEGAPLPEGEHRTFEFRDVRPLSEEQRKRFEEMARDFEKRGAEFEVMAREHEGRALAMAARAPRVIQRCDEGSEGVNETVDDSGKKTIIICERRIEERAKLGALGGLRGARAMIAGNRELSAEARDEILRDLDREIARIESENAGS